MSEQGMVERVARAMAEKNRGVDLWDEIADDGDVDYIGRNDYRDMAKAAIKAMREPTEAMVQAVRKSAPHDIDAAESWPIMVDEALK